MIAKSLDTGYFNETWFRTMRAEAMPRGAGR